MSFIRDIVDIKDAMKDIDIIEKQDEINKILKKKSITKWSKDAVMQFPLLMSDSLSISAGEKVGSALEKNYATLIELIVNLNSITDDESPEEYIRGIHQNIDTGISMTDLNYLFKESVEIPSINSDVVRDEIDDEFNKKLRPISELEKIVGGKNCIDIKKQCQDVSDSVEIGTEDKDDVEVIDIEDKPSLMTESKSAIIMSLGKGNFFSYNNTIVRLSEDNSRYDICVPLLVEGYKTAVVAIKDNLVKSIQESIGYNINKNDIHRSNIGLLDEHLSQLNMNILNEKKSKTGTVINNNVNQSPRTLISPKIKPTINIKTDDAKGGIPPRSRVVDREIKKANEAMPTIIEMDIVFKDKNDKNTRMQFSVGVKTILHPIPSKEVIDNLSSATRNNGKLFNFIRWTTGEIAFFKDFLFGIDNIKNDALNMSNFKSSWWTILKKRKRISQIKRNILAKNQLLPNTTILINTSEADYLKNVMGVDIRNINIVKKIMDDYFLLGFVIVDEELEVVEIIYDSENSYQTYTYNALERTSSKGNDISKDLLKLMTRM